MRTMLELSEETSQQLATLAAYQQRPLEEMLRLCLRAYEQYQYHLVHQQMIAEELLEALPPLRALGAADEADDDFGARQPFVQNGPLGCLTNRVGADKVAINSLN